MFKFILLMVIPVIIFIYTLSFGRWMGRKDIRIGAFTAYVVAIIAIAISGYAFWVFTF